MSYTVSSQNTEENERTQQYFLILNLNGENEPEVVGFESPDWPESSWSLQSRLTIAIGIGSN